MSLKALYEKFLARPDPELLSADAALNYITTTTAFNGRDAVAKHLIKHNNIVKKKSEKILSVVEGPSSLCLDIELTAEFVIGGGSYLLSLDENFLVDRVVTFPLIHIVQFDSERKISQIRVYWDQGSLLKQVEVIGAHSRNWPIRDGTEQARLIKSAADKQAEVASSQESELRKNDSNGPSIRQRAQSPTKDPHSSLSLFDSLSLDEGRQEHPMSNPAPRGSAKPPPRDYHELFGGEDADVTPTKPGKPVAPKGGVSHRYKQSRIFEEDDGSSQTAPQTPITSSKKYHHFEFGESAVPTPTPATKTKTFSHFEFGEAEVPTSPAKPTPSKPIKPVSHFEFGEEEAPKPVSQPAKTISQFELGDDHDDEHHPKPSPAKKKTKNMSQWDFEDFGAPAETKPQRKVRGQEVRHFAWSDEENDPVETPPKHPRVVPPRRDAEIHFKIQDEMTPLPAEKQAGRMGAAHNRGLKLYENNLFNDSDDVSAETADKPAGLSGVHRKKDFDSHWTMTDEPSLNGNAKEQSKPLPSDRIKAVKMMDSSWDMNDLDDAFKPKPAAAKRASRNVNQPSWSFGDDDI